MRQQPFELRNKPPCTGGTTHRFLALILRGSPRQRLPATAQTHLKKGEPTMSALDCCDWTDVRTVLLRRLWDGGVTTAEIGRQMGLSKNAVIGKAHRLRLPPRPSPIRTSTSGIVRQRRVPVPKLADLVPLTALVDPTASPPPPPPPRSPPRSPTEAPSQVSWRRISANLEPDPCCWPIGHPRTASFRYCDAPAQAGKPYCAEHLGLAYARPRRRQQGPTNGECEPSSASCQQQR